MNDEEIQIEVEEPAPELTPMVPEFDAERVKPRRPVVIEMPYHAEFDDVEPTRVGSVRRAA